MQNWFLIVWKVYQLKC